MYNDTKKILNYNVNVVSCALLTQSQREMLNPSGFFFLYETRFIIEE